MKVTLLLFIVLLSLVGAFTLDDFIFHVVYLIAGAFLIGNWWTKHTLSSLTIARKLPTYAFPGETIPVTLQVMNSSWFPIPWLFIQESLPLEVSRQKFIRQVLNLPAKSSRNIQYELYSQKRGFYPIGPAEVSSGDMMGLSPDVYRQSTPSFLTVFPKVIPLGEVALPSISPTGILRHHQPIFEDPNRITGKRVYTPGDSLRRIDWKSTAATGQLQVKLFEPSKAIETAIFLDLSRKSYRHKFFYDSIELAIVVAASLANWITERKQAIGLITNGIDATTNGSVTNQLIPRKGRANLIHILELLARLQMSDAEHITSHIRNLHHRLAWGTTLIALTGYCDQELLDELSNAKRNGLSVMLVLVGELSDYQTIKRKTQMLNIPHFYIRDESDLDIWRR